MVELTPRTWPGKRNLTASRAFGFYVRNPTQHTSAGRRRLLQPQRLGTKRGRKASSKDLTRKVEQTMWLGIISSATMLLFAVPAFADSCLFSAAPPFQLSSDAVEWTMQIASGTTCTRGLKLGSTNIKDVKLIAPPQSGKVDIQGPSFSYTAKADFQGQDEFTVQVSGTVVRIAGVSDVKVTVSVVDK